MYEAGARRIARYLKRICRKVVLLSRFRGRFILIPTGSWAMVGTDGWLADAHIHVLIRPTEQPTDCVAVNSQKAAHPPSALREMGWRATHTICEGATDSPCLVGRACWSHCLKSAMIADCRRMQRTGKVRWLACDTIPATTKTGRQGLSGLGGLRCGNGRMAPFFANLRKIGTIIPLLRPITTSFDSCLERPVRGNITQGAGFASD